jgi:hypothetical protein
MSKPLIQIDDLIREMTDEEYAQWQEVIERRKASANEDAEQTS